MNHIAANRAKLLAELRAAVKKLPRKTAGGNKLRYFARTQLQMKNGGEQRIREWLKDPMCMSLEECQLLRRVLSGQNASAGKDLSRRVVSHTVAVLSSLKGLVVDADIKKTVVNDGDRMYIRSAVEEICRRTGVVATFRDPGDQKSRPATQADLAGTGFKNKG